MTNINNRLAADGSEALDATPAEIPIGFKKPETLAEQVQRLVRGSLSRAAHDRGFETFEESEDFHIDEDPVDYDTPYETHFDPVLGRDISPKEFLDNESTYKKKYLELLSKNERLQEEAEKVYKKRSKTTKATPATTPASAPADAPGDAHNES